MRTLLEVDTWSGQFFTVKIIPEKNKEYSNYLDYKQEKLPIEKLGCVLYAAVDIRDIGEPDKNGHTTYPIIGIMYYPMASARFVHRVTIKDNVNLLTFPVEVMKHCYGEGNYNRLTIPNARVVINYDIPHDKLAGPDFGLDKPFYVPKESITQ